jgi:hypothetical protein
MGKYEQIGQQIGALVDIKNKQYGNAINGVETFLIDLYPDGIKPEQYKDLGILVRVYDKIKRIVNGNQGEENAWQDIAGYAILQCGNCK